MQSQLDAQSVPADEWFQAKDADSQVFTLSGEPLADSVDEVRVNGLNEDGSNYSLQQKDVTVMMRLKNSDRVEIKYRKAR